MTSRISCRSVIIQYVHLAHSQLFQCAMPVFDGLFLEPHNTSVLKLLFMLCHWHGLAKLRIHTNETLEILDAVTVSLGRELHTFSVHTYLTFLTHESKYETERRLRHQQQLQSRTWCPFSQGLSVLSRQPKTFDLQMYKLHALSDYMSSIRRYGTTDSYSTQLVWYPHD